MNSIFKKTLIAAALAGMASANAATIEGRDTDGTETGVQVPKISSEGLAALGYVLVGDVTDTITNGTAASVDNDASNNDIEVFWEPGTSYGTTDFLLMTIAGATVLNTDASQITLVETTSGKAVTAIGINTETGVLTFRPDATTGSAADSFDVGERYAVHGLRLDDADISTSITVATEGQAGSGVQFDQTSATSVATVGSEMSLASATQSFGRVIDVENEREQFTVDSARTSSDVTTDEALFTLTQTADVLGVNLTQSSIALTGGDLSFALDEDAELDADSYELIDGVTVGTNTITVNSLTESSVTSEAASLSDDNTTLTLNSAAGSATIGVQLTLDGQDDDVEGAVPAQDFDADLTFTYAYTHTGTNLSSGTHGSTEGSVAYTDQAAGGWTLSGADVEIEFMPYGTGITQFIYVANYGDVAGAMELTVLDNSGTVYGPYDLGVTATANAVTRIGAEVLTVLEDNGINTSSGRLAFTLTVNSPADDIEVTAGYNSRGDRVLIK